MSLFTEELIFTYVGFTGGLLLALAQLPQVCGICFLYELLCHRSLLFRALHTQRLVHWSFVVLIVTSSVVGGLTAQSIRFGRIPAQECLSIIAKASRTSATNEKSAHVYDRLNDTRYLVPYYLYNGID